MPRSKRSKEKFTTISIEQKSYDVLHSKKWPKEPIYNTFHRVLCIYSESEVEASQCVINDLQELCKRQKERIDKLEAERKYTLRLDKFI